MADYIDRRDAIAQATEEGTYGYVSAEELTQLPSVDPLTDNDYIELCDRFGKWVAFVVKDMISGEGKRWKMEH